MQEQKIQHLHFQKQSYFSSQCGVCALNNLVGDEIFQKEDLTKICSQLSQDIINPYKSVFGGDYDVTVLIVALQEIGYPVRWLKKTESLDEVLSVVMLKGLLINTPQKSMGAQLLKLINQSGRHWTCMRKIGEKLVLLDSLQSQPLYLKSRQQAVELLQVVRKEEGTILVVELPQAKEEGSKLDE